MNAPDSSFPLAWPIAWPRCRNPTRAKFGVASRQQSDGTWRYGSKLTIGAARDRLLSELQRLGARNVVISSNIRARGDGLPYANAAEPSDHGAAVYFRLKGEPRVLACDKWDRVADNLAALAKHIEAVRGQVRWGVGSLEQAFGGYKALPAMGEVKQWWEILGVPADATIEVVEAKRDKLLMQHHPDRGGSHSRAAEINAAFDAACRELGGA